ncbi:division/cell wall cluster transcriptional repressor MraZ [Qingshengfaniella alkalisoli]|uniref:Transcriptional regulator MraZ n=1 Tax=Qingshengfaniella alkalisoli TaxID=2599296 RepID=A0A5B8IX44_9RHOB|nr:division/cell wall cluster transcriptional repressor MraZ [Qingshengfaniella alkalisoli]QDY69461.1 division/cell wall cluster transcriptional repressor MraZ [Qingshengfaniella alkalisoli]
MGRRFRGESTQKVDSKGRVSIPATFRRVLEAGDPDWVEGKPANLVIVYADERRNFLECYTMDAISEVDSKIAQMKRGSPARVYMERIFNGQSIDASVDGTGRLVLPKKARDKIGLENDCEAFFIASGDTFQIWKPETFEASQSINVDELFEGLPEGADPLMLLDQEG